MHILSQASLPSVHPQQSSVSIFPRLKSGCYFLKGDSQELFNVNPLSFAFWRYCPSNLSFFKKLVFSEEHWVTLLKTYLSNCLPWISCFGSFLIWEDYPKKLIKKKLDHLDFPSFILAPPKFWIRLGSCDSMSSFVYSYWQILSFHLGFFYWSS